jgi:hypothetical protein
MSALRSGETSAAARMTGVATPNEGMCRFDYFFLLFFFFAVFFAFLAFFAMSLSIRKE